MFFSVPGVKKIYYSNFFRFFSGCFFYDFSGFFPGCRNTSCRVPGAGCRVPCYHVVTDFPFNGFFNASLGLFWESRVVRLKVRSRFQLKVRLKVKVR